MATSKDSFLTGDDANFSLSSAYWAAQTFTASSTYYVYSVKLKMYKSAGAIGNMPVAIRATDGSGVPTGTDLCVGTIDVSTFTATSPGLWYEIVFTTNPILTSGIVYAIILKGEGYVTVAAVQWRTDTANGYSGGKQFTCSDEGVTWTPLATFDGLFDVYSAPIVVDKKYTKRLVAVGGDEVWYESSVGTMTELTAANQTIDSSLPLSVVEAYQKVFIVNKTNLKVADFANTKINTTDAGLNPCTRDMTLTGGTSLAAMIVDYVDGVTDNAAANIYGYRTTTATFSSGETVTGTNSAGNAVSFVISAAETAPPHWYNWTVFGNDTTNYGTMLTQPTLICLYRGRVVISGDSTKPHAWQMSKVGNPFKVLYDFTNDGNLSGVAYSNSTVGVLGDIVTVLITYKDDLLFFGCANSLYILIGDPLAEGQIAQITKETGIWGPKAWCIDSKNNLYFFGSDGVYRMPITETVSQPENISKIQLPKLVSDWDLDKSLHRVVLSFDPINYGILVTKTTLADGTCESWWYDLITQGWFNESYPASCGIFSSYFYPATDETYKKFLIGCNDGYIREFDWSTKNDATTSSTTAINSYLTIIKQLAEDDDKNGFLQSLNIVLAGGASSGAFSDTDGLSYALYKGNDAETVLEDIIDAATAFQSGSWTGTGEKNRIIPRMTGTWMGIKLYNSTASQTFAIEKVFADIYKRGTK